MPHAARCEHQARIRLVQPTRRKRRQCGVQRAVHLADRGRREAVPAQRLGYFLDLARRYTLTYISASALTNAFSERW
jgi:hypothetical protein